MRLFRILKKPVVTEKTSNLEMTQNTYVFIVASDATKIDVKKAVLELYWVEVGSVNILNTREKFKFWKKYCWSESKFNKNQKKNSQIFNR